MIPTDIYIVPVTPAISAYHTEALDSAPTNEQDGTPHPQHNHNPHISTSEIITEPPKIHQLPAELLHAVFTWLATIDVPNARSSVGCQLALVSKQWKDFVYTMPDFWSHFELHIDMDERVARHPSLSQLTRCIRSPLTVLITVKHGTSELPSAFLPTIQKLKNQSARWKHLSIGRPGSNNQNVYSLPSSLLKALLPPSLPNLVHATVCNLRAGLGFPLASSAPKLQSLINLERNPALFKDSTNITHATFAYVPGLLLCAPILATTCLNVEHLEFVIRQPEPPTGRIELSPPPQQLNRLKTLFISGFSATRVLHILAIIRAPQLHTIQVSSMLTPQDWSRIRTANLDFPSLSFFQFLKECDLSDIRQIVSRIAKPGGLVVELPAELQPRDLNSEAPEDDDEWLAKNVKEVRWPVNEVKPKHADIGRELFGTLE